MRRATSNQRPEQREPHALSGVEAFQYLQEKHLTSVTKKKRWVVNAIWIVRYAELCCALLRCAMHTFLLRKCFIFLLFAFSLSGKAVSVGVKRIVTVAAQRTLQYCNARKSVLVCVCVSVHHVSDAQRVPKEARAATPTLPRRNAARMQMQTLGFDSFLPHLDKDCTVQQASGTSGTSEVAVGNRGLGLRAQCDQSQLSLLPRWWMC